MSRCQDQECHDKVITLENTKADKTCLQKYFKKPPGWLLSIIIAVIIIPLLLAGFNVVSQQRVNEKKFAPIEDCQSNRERVIVLEENIKAIQEIKDSMKEQNIAFNKQIEGVKTLIRQIDK